jgi:hypothetical protein
MTTTHTTRESWLLAAVETLRPIFAEAGYELPEHVRISTGFGLTIKGENTSILAQTISTKGSRDGIATVLVSPVLETIPDVLGALGHELIHVADDCQDGHGSVFAKAMKALGFDGKPTEALPSTETVTRWVELAADLGMYPHIAIDLSAVYGRRPAAPGEGDEPSKGRGKGKTHSGPAPQGTRMIKVVCSVDDDSKWTVRQTKGNAEKWGMARCGCHGEPGAWA